MKARVFAFLLMLVSFVIGTSATFAADTSLRDQCAKQCQKTLSYLKKTGGKHAEPATLKAVEDCIASCKSNSKAHKAGAADVAKMDESCSSVCKHCAEVCEALNDPKLKDCIALCNKCAAACNH